MSDDAKGLITALVITVAMWVTLLGSIYLALRLF